MKLLTFELGENKYGLAITEVKSIEEMKKVVEIPNSLPYIRGIIDLHGDIVPIYSLAEKFGYGKQQIQSIIVTEVNGKPIGFEVTRAQEILDVPQDTVLPMPEIITYRQNYTTDVANYQKKLIILLDVAKLFSQEEIEHIQEFVDGM